MSDGQTKAVAVVGQEPHKDYETIAPFVVYDAAGNIEQAGQQGISFTTDAMARGERILLAEIPWSPFLLDLRHYVDVETKALREKAPCAATLDGQTLRGLPVPCRIEIRSATSFGASPTVYEWTESDCALSFDHPDVWAVRVLSAPCLPGEFTVKVNA